MTDLKISFTVSQTPQQVFDAIINVRGWWSESLEGDSKQQGDEFIYHHKDLHYSKHLLTEVITNKKVTWLTTDSSLNFVDNKTEWTGTTVVFDIEEQGSQTTLHFTHIGLVPELACYEACNGGWSHYLQSLHDLIATGKGNPDKKPD